MTKGKSPQIEPLPKLPEHLKPREGETSGERLVRFAAQLMQLGVSNLQIRRLLMHDPDKIERQLEWLPYRAARKRSSLIVAAIERDFEAPANWTPHEES